MYFDDEIDVFVIAGGDAFLVWDEMALWANGMYRARQMGWWKTRENRRFAATYHYRWILNLQCLNL